MIFKFAYNYKEMCIFKNHFFHIFFFHFHTDEDTTKQCYQKLSTNLSFNSSPSVNCHKFKNSFIITRLLIDAVTVRYVVVLCTQMTERPVVIVLSRFCSRHETESSHFCRQERVQDKHNGFWTVLKVNFLKQHSDTILSTSLIQ